MELAAIHNLCFADGLLVLFGRSFLIRYYKKHLDNNFGVVVFDLNNRVLGFAVATTKKSSPFSSVKFSSFFSLFLNLVKRPIKTTVSIIGYLFRDQSDDTEKYQKQIELSHFAVMPEFQSEGIGKQLIKKFELTCLGKNYSRITTRTHNDRLANFYKKEKMAKTISTRKEGQTVYYVLTWDIGRK